MSLTKCTLQHNKSYDYKSIVHLVVSPPLSNEQFERLNQFITELLNEPA